MCKMSFLYLKIITMQFFIHLFASCFIGITFFSYAGHELSIFRRADLDPLIFSFTTMVNSGQFCSAKEGLLATVCIAEGVAIVLYNPKTHDGCLAHIMPHQYTDEYVNDRRVWFYNIRQLLNDYTKDTGIYLHIHVHARKDPEFMAKIVRQIKVLSSARVTSSFNSDRDLFFDLQKGNVFTGQITPSKMHELISLRNEQCDVRLLQKITPIS